MEIELLDDRQPGSEDNSDDVFNDSDIHHAVLDPSDVGSSERCGSIWEKISFDSGEYEGETVSGKPNGYGRMIWNSPPVAYHGMFRDQCFHGKGCFFFENGDRFEGDFVHHKPCGQGLLTTQNKRYTVFYDGTKRISDGAEPTILGDAPDEQIPSEIRFTISGMSKGLNSAPFGLGNYVHCRPLDGKLAHAIPFRANQPLRNAEAVEGKIAVVLRGGCGFAAKVDHCQRAGAVAVVIVGCDNDTKYLLIIIDRFTFNNC